MGRYAGGKKKNPHVVGKILGTMSQRMYEFNGGLRKKEKAKAEALKKQAEEAEKIAAALINCLLYTSPSPRDRQKSRMPSSA